MEDDAEIAPEIELTISNWDTLFGEEGIVKTPLGEVKMGENQFAKLMRQGRESKLGMIKPTLENPDVIIEASSEAKEGSITERGSSYIFVKAFRKSDGSRYYYFTSVTVSKEGKEVVVSSQEKSRNRLLRLLTDEEIIWRTPKDATTSSAERQGLDYVQPLDAETATKGSGLTPQRISSADKVTESSEEWQEQEEKFSPTPSGNTGGEEGTYTLSSKTSENGESFYQNNDGNIDLADIPDEVFDKIGKPKAPFRLTPSMLKHVFDRHGKEMGLHHADDAIDFVLDVLNNFDHVRQGDKGAIIFSIENGRSRTRRRAVTILLDSQRGEYYGIKTSGYERIEGLHKRPLLWEKGAKETSATGVAPANVTTNETQQGNELTGSASNHGNDPMGKVTESSEELQGKEKNFTPAPIEDGEVQSASVKYQPIIRATFNKVKREQGIIEPIAEKKRKPFTVFDVTVKEPRRPMFGGVYHDGGMAVATNGVVMFAHKEAYDEAKEGKIITSKGDVIEGKFPDWRGAIPKETIPTGLQTEPLLEFVNGALARMKAEKAKKYEVDGALAYIKFQDGNVVCCQLADLQKMLRAAKSIGADDLRLGTDKEFLVAESPAGKAIVIIQGEEKARYNAGYNNFAYEAPTVKGKEEVSDGALDNPYPSEKEVEQEANEATEKSKEERNEERVTRTQKKRGRPTKGQQEYRKRKEREARKKEAKELSEEYKRLSEETDELWNILKENKDAPEELVIEGFHSEASWVRATAAEHKNLPPSLLEEAIADPSLRKYAIKNKNITDSQFHHAVKLSLKDGNTEFFRSLNSDDRLTEEESLSIMTIMWEAHSKRYGTIYFSSKYPSVLRRFYENHGTQLLAQKVLARDKNTPQDILEKLYESGNEEVRLEIAGNDSVPIPVVLKMLDLPNNLAFRENLAYRRNLPQDIISRLFHDNSKSVRQTIIQFQPLDLDLMNKILKKKNITELGLLAENRNTPIFIQDSILAIPAPPKSWGVNGDYYLKEIQKKARLGIAQNKHASAGLLEDLYNEISSGRLLSDSDLGEAIAEHPNTSKSVLADIYSRFGEKYPRIKEAIEKRSDFMAKEVEQESKDDNTGNVVLKQFSNVLLSADTESQRLATDAALEGLKRAGVPVEVVSDEQAAVMLGEQKGVELSAKQKRALETASPAMQDHHTVVSSADGTKVLKDLDNTIEEYEKLKGNKPNTLIGDIAKVLGATRHGSNSEYASFETKNGKLVTIRLANHNAKVSTFDNNGESEGLSIVITPKENAKLTNDGEAHITEFYYNAVKLRRAEGKPLVEILKSIKQALYSGEYKDTTGLAEVQEVNVPRAELHMVYHGSGADFDAFDHSHMGEGEGQQAYGWGTYVTEVEGIGEQYAEANHGNLDFDEEAFYDEANEYIEEVFGSRDGLDYAYNDGGFEIFNVNRNPETLNYFLDYFKEHPNEFDSWEDPNEIDVSTLDEKGIEELGRALERSMDDVVQEDVQALFEKYMTVPARHLYSVEIPDDTGSNYLDYTKNYADNRSGINTDHFIDALYDEILSTDDDHLYDSKQAKKELRKELSELDFSFGKDIYGDISSYLGSDKKASEFLHRQGVVGISYPAQYRSGGREDDARNYVIFDEEDLKITDHVQFMKTPSGTLYGWTVGGKIYLTKDGLNPNTPIHEYTHLWARAMKERNKEGWQSVKELLRDTPVWDEVLKDKNYQDILDDEDAIASEALSRISGKKNAGKMEAEARKMIDEAKDYVDKAKAISLLERMKSALKKFWNWVGKDLFGIKKFSSVDEITDRVLYDLTNGTDLKGAASEKVEKQQVSTGSEEERAIIEHAKESGTYMKAPNGEPTRLTEKQWAQVRTKAFKSWFGDWEKAARIEKLRKSEPVVITGEEYKGKYELNRDSAKAWIKDNLRGEYTIADTGEKIAIGRKGINKVTSHSMGNETHLKSLIAVPKMLEQSVFITEEKADKLNAQYPTYRYYVVGLNIAGVDYTAKLTIGVDENGNKYYDHALTEIEKGKLLDQINGQAVDNGFMSTGAEPNPSVTDSKDTKLVSILQTNSSKFVDENGEPMVFYHNTNNNFSVFDSKRNGTHTDAGWLGDGFYFYGDENEGSGYGNIKMGVFLNVRDPYYATSKENNQLAEANSRDMSVDFRENLEEEGYDGVFYNGDLRQEAVVFEPNQIKSATDNNGEFSQESDDIRYRESKGSSERTLVGIHNISADKLSKAIKQGGLANPSVAVIDISKQQHTGYGEISLIMPSDKINKRTGKNAGTFEGDAWTPMYPSVERQMSREGSLVMEHDIKALPNEMQLGVRNALRNWLDNRVDTKLSYLYLFQQGKAPDFETIKPKYNKEVHRAFGDIMHEVTNVYDLSKNDIEKLVDLYVKTELNGDFDEFNQSYERNIAKHKEILSNKKPGSLRYEKALIYLRDAEEYGRPIDVLQRFVDEVWRDKNTQGRVSIEKTFDAANKKIKEDGLEHDYKKWTDGLNERYQTKEVIFDGFTPSGMRRYVPNTLENVSKLMKKQGRNASNGIGSSFSNFAASVMKANTSLDSIRKKKGKLTNDHQDLDDFEEKWQDVYVDLSRKLQPDANAYDDYGFARLQEAASKADPQAYLQKEYGVTLSDEDTQRLKDMVKAIKEERPSMYFETKFERPVTFDEFAAAVVPHNTDAEIKQQLRDAGLKVVEYEAGNEESRAKAVEEASKSDDIRFRQEERAARELAEVNERFNEELQKQIDGTLPAGHVYQLGMPGEILLAAGFPTMPIELSATRLSEKSRQANHIFKLSEVKDLVKEINNPMAIFRYGNNAKNVIVGIEHNGKQFLVGVHFNQSHRGMEISDVRGIFPKDNAEWLNWISQGKADYLNKEKIQTLIDQQRINLAEVDYLDLDSVANILKDFQNPTIDGKNHSALSENTLPAEPSHDREAMRNEAVQLSDKLHTPIKIVEDVKDITHSNAEVERRKRNSKGWYDVRTGEVVVVLPNNRDVEDVAATVMHETVAHKGLRELVGEEHYDDFLDEVYKHLRGDLKQRVDAEAGRAFVDDTTKNGERAKSYEQHRRTAVDELFGDMAEKPFEEFSEGERTLWQKLKEVVRKLLDKFLESLKLPKWFELGDNELRYMLWRSKERLERGKEHPIDFARDMVMREELGLSESARMRMGDTPDTFKARQRRAVEEKGIVMPGLNEAEVKVVRVPRHSFTGTGKDALRSAERWAKDNITGMHTATNSDGIEFDYNISGKSIEKYVSASSIAKSENLGVHLSVLKTLPNVIANSIEVEEHADYAKDKSSKRSVENEVNAQSLMHRFYGAVNIDGKLYRVKTTIREYADTNRNANAHNYELTKIELLDAPSVGGIETSNRPVAMTSNSSISVAKLLKDVEKSYDSGKKVLDESRKADENPILYRDGEETEDIWKDKSMGLHERTTAAAMRLADKHQENKTLRNDAMRAIGNNLADLRKAMSLQRKFDMATVKRVSDLARVLMNNGYIGDMTQQEVKSLLAAVRNSVGHNDIDRDVQKVMEIMVKNQLRRAEKALSALETIKGSKVNAKGVKVQGKLDAAGAQLMEVFKNIIEPIVNNHTLM